VVKREVVRLGCVEVDMKLPDVSPFWAFFGGFEVVGETSGETLG
jgi:hypothetical protein